MDSVHGAEKNMNGCTTLPDFLFKFFHFPLFCVCVGVCVCVGFCQAHITTLSLKSVPVAATFEPQEG